MSRNLLVRRFVMPVSNIEVKLSLGYSYMIPVQFDSGITIDSKQFKKLFHLTCLDLIDKTGINWFTSYSAQGNAYFLHGDNDMWTPLMFSLVEMFFGDAVIPDHVKKLKTGFAVLTLYDRAQIMFNIFNVATDFKYNVSMTSREQFSNDELLNQSCASNHRLRNSPIQSGIVGIRNNKRMDGYIPDIRGMKRIDIRHISSSQHRPYHTISTKKQTQNCTIDDTHSMRILDFSFLNDQVGPEWEIFNEYAVKHDIIITATCGMLFVPEEHEQAIRKLIETNWQPVIDENLFKYQLDMSNVNIIDFDLFNKIKDSGLLICEITYPFLKNVFRDKSIDVMSSDLIIALDSESNKSVKIFAKDMQSLVFTKMYV